MNRQAAYRNCFVILLLTCMAGLACAQPDAAIDANKQAHRKSAPTTIPGGERTANVAGQWRNVLRQRLAPPQTPLAGLYESDDPAVIQEHISQSRRAGLGVLGRQLVGTRQPDGSQLPRSDSRPPEANQLQYAVLYESTGRLGSQRQAELRQLAHDLAYLEEHYFNHPQYLRVDGRPVLFVYLTRVYFRDRGGEALAAMRENSNGRVPDRRRCVRRRLPEQVGPAVRRRDRLRRVRPKRRPARADAEGGRRARGELRDGQEAANAAGAAFIPTVAPGYNDTVIREGHPGAAR